MFTLWSIIFLIRHCLFCSFFWPWYPYLIESVALNYFLSSFNLSPCAWAQFLPWSQPEYEAALLVGLHPGELNINLLNLHSKWRSGDHNQCRASIRNGAVAQKYLLYLLLVNVCIVSLTYVVYCPETLCTMTCWEVSWSSDVHDTLYYVRHDMHRGRVFGPLMYIFCTLQSTVQDTLWRRFLSPVKCSWSCQTQDWPVNQSSYSH